MLLKICLIDRHISRSTIFIGQVRYIISDQWVFLWISLVRALTFMCRLLLLHYFMSYSYYSFLQCVLWVYLQFWSYDLTANYFFRHLGYLSNLFWWFVNIIYVLFSILTYIYIYIHLDIFCILILVFFWIITFLIAAAFLKLSFSFGFYVRL